jgi:2,3,4,5-tetrahydropyridine-2-carboxylate N-succinyltransferase
VRRGAYLGKDVVLMPSFVNIGAYVAPAPWWIPGRRWGSCAQIGAPLPPVRRRRHRRRARAAAGRPTIIEDDCFVGARSEVVEGVVVERGSVIGMGVFLGQSTRIYDRATKTSATAACRRAASSCPVRCRPPMARTRCTAR